MGSETTLPYSLLLRRFNNTLADPVTWWCRCLYDLLASENPRKSAQLCPPKGRQNALLLSLMLQMPDESDRRKQTKGSSNCESGEKSGFAAAAAAATQANTLLSTNRRSLLSPSTLLTTHSLPHTPPSVHTHPLCQHTGNIETTQMGVVRGNDEMREQKRGCERERTMIERWMREDGWVVQQPRSEDSFQLLVRISQTFPELSKKVFKEVLQSRFKRSEI